MENFAKEMIRRLEEHYGNEAEITYQKFLKRNDICYSAVVIRSKEANVGKIIYLEHYLEAYRKGTSMEEIIEDVLEKERNCEIPKTDDVGLILQRFPKYDSIKSEMMGVLCNLEKNQEYLKGKTYIEFFDLALVFYGVIMEDATGIGKIAIPEDIFCKWKISKEQLFLDAYTYGMTVHPKRWKMELVEIDQYLATILGAEDDFNQYMNPPDSMMYVLSNKSGINGAAVMFYPGIMKEVAEEVGWNQILIFPSSIHELLLVDAERWEENFFGELKKHVRYVNEHCVSETEFLSNNIYRYTLEDDRLEIAEER